MAGLGTRELATPLVSSQPAGALQQVMSPTLGQGYGTTAQQPSPPPGRDGLQQTSGSTPTLVQGQSGGMGFEPNMATGGAPGGVDQHEPSGGSGGMPPGSTTIRVEMLHIMLCRRPMLHRARAQVYRPALAG